MDTTVSVRDISVKASVVKEYNADWLDKLFVLKSSGLISPAAAEIRDMLAQLTKPYDLGVIEISPKDGQPLDQAVNAARGVVSRYVTQVFKWPKIANTGRHSYRTVAAKNEDGKTVLYVQRLPMIQEERGGLPLTE